MANEVQYNESAGTADQLPRGEATKLNEQLPTENPKAPDGVQAPSDAEMAAAGADEAQFKPAAHEDFQPGYEPTSEDDVFITGPSGRPDESQLVGTQSPGPISNRVRNSLPELQKAASEPGASPELIAMVKLLLREVG